MKTTLDVDINQIQEMFDRALIQDNSYTERRVRRMIAQELDRAKKTLQTAASANLKNDPREAYKAVSYAVYKKIIGGNVNIMNRRQAQGQQWRTSRRGASQKTLRIDSYRGADRGFILRWANQGTDDRVAETMNNHAIRTENAEDRYKNRKGGYKSSTIGYRGSITPVNWFNKTAAQAMNVACKSIAETIEKMVQEQFGA